MNPMKLNDIEDGTKVYKFRDCNPQYIPVSKEGDTYNNLQLNNKYILCEKKIWSISSLLNNEFWAATPESLNDVSEIYTLNNFKEEKINSFNNKTINLIKGITENNTTEKEMRKELGLISDEAYRVSIAQNFSNYGVFCTSFCPTNPNLWALYSDSSRGFAIEYDLKSLYLSTNPADIFPIRYNQDMETIYGNGIMAPGHFYCQKSDYFEKEEEFRFLYEKSGIVKYEPNCVTGIIFGSNMCEKNRKQLHKLISTKLKNINFMQAIHKKDNFGFDIVKWE
ncbi:hypothetical protein [Thorsellia kenyensis]|uniref:DUF2971 domain-containing protein n=1 Tax=Thorsellia kenyensis TaxID=1549888 RepID=A0ABV6CCR6_9GAMM